MTKEDELTAGLRAELARVDARLAQVTRPQNCGTGYCSCIECVVEPAQRPVKTYHDGKPWPVAQPVVSLQCANCVVTIETLNDKVMQLMAAREPLTDEQIDALPLPPSGTATVRDLVRIIEAAHGIKGAA